tara:strand:+ start:246 stop:524 length:279 start_codon:yes stop_codon:yes gene_type:complete
MPLPAPVTITTGGGVSLSLCQLFGSESRLEKKASASPGWEKRHHVARHVLSSNSKNQCTRVTRFAGAHIEDTITLPQVATPTARGVEMKIAF